MAVPSFAAPYAAAWTKCPLFRAHSGRDGSPFADSHSNPAVSFVGVWRASVLLGLLRLEFEAAFAIGHRRSSAKMPTAPQENVNVWWECVELSPHHFRAAQAHALASRPEMALSRQDVNSAAHCAIRPILLFRKWEDVSRAIHMHNCTEAHPAPLVALEAPVELPPRASALAAWHRAKAGGAVDRAEGCRRPSRGEVRANGATRGVNACTTARRKTLRWTGSPSWSLRHRSIDGASGAFAWCHAEMPEAPRGGSRGG